MACSSCGGNVVKPVVKSVVVTNGKPNETKIVKVVYNGPK